MIPLNWGLVAQLVEKRLIKSGGHGGLIPTKAEDFVFAL